MTNFAADNGGITLYRDADTLNIESITVDGMTVTGITTTGDDVKLTVDANDLDIDEDISLGSGNLFLDVAGNVTQQAGDTITAAGLALMVDGTTTLTDAGQRRHQLRGQQRRHHALPRRRHAQHREHHGGRHELVTGITTSGDDVKLTVDA